MPFSAQPPALPVRLVFFPSLLAATLVALGTRAEPVRRPAALPPPPTVAGVPDSAKALPNPLVWDATRKLQKPKPGQVTADFSFLVTNPGSEEVVIKQIVPGCGCTVATMPSNPWVLAPGTSGSFTATLDFAGKQGTVSKTLQVESNRGTQVLTIAVDIPQTDPAVRRRNREVAERNRQAVFQNGCAVCHAAPLAGIKGAELFAGACGICHLAPSRADVVPDLRIARESRDTAYWRKWILEGKAGTLMPAFAKSQGGPLTDDQIESLVEHVLAALPTTPRVLPKLGGNPPGAMGAPK